MKLRTIITQDGEVDDQNSLRHFLFYANEVELQGIVLTSSKFHWRGMPGRQNPDGGPAFDRPYRWTGTDWMRRVIDDYEKDYPQLRCHAAGYPDPAYLRGITKVGNVGYRGETESATEGSELIRKAILDDDPRRLYLQVWGGCNAIARALMDVQAELEHGPHWPQMHRRLSEKIVITACGEQDDCYRDYLGEYWPDICFVNAVQMGSYAYSWLCMPEGESKQTLRADFMVRNILKSGSALASGYCTWMDGQAYEGEASSDQFGINPNITREWFGTRLGLPEPHPYDFLSEGDSPAFFLLLDWGFRTLEELSWGGIAGRYQKATDRCNSKGEMLNVWNPARDLYTDGEGKTCLTESMWPYVADIQRDFAARAAWAAEPLPEKGEHRPELRLSEGRDRLARPGETLRLQAGAISPEGAQVTVSFRVYPEAGADWSTLALLEASDGTARVTIPPEAVPGDRLHILVKAQTATGCRLTRYDRVIVTVE